MSNETTSATEPVVRKTIIVEAPVERAFHVFVERFGEVKPLEHNLLGVPSAQATFEPRVGGHIYDRADDGRECRWARVLAYEPPERLVFTWDLNPAWQLETDLANTSEVEIRFVAERADRTRVELEHRHLDRHGTGWEHIHSGVDEPGGWPLYLQRFAALFTPATGG